MLPRGPGAVTSIDAFTLNGYRALTARSLTQRSSSGTGSDVQPATGAYADSDSTPATCRLMTDGIRAPAGFRNLRLASLISARMPASNPK
jgi:hypothetical protein